MLEKCCAGVEHADVLSHLGSEVVENDLMGNALSQKIRQVAPQDVIVCHYGTGFYRNVVRMDCPLVDQSYMRVCCEVMHVLYFERSVKATEE